MRFNFFLITSIILTSLGLKAQDIELQQIPQPSINPLLSDSGYISESETLVGDSLVALQDTIIYESLCDSVLACVYAPETRMSTNPLPRQLFLIPPVFYSYELLDSIKPFDAEYSNNPGMKWIEDANSVALRSRTLLQNMMISRPDLVDFNGAWFPEPLKEFVAEVNPENNTVTLIEKDVIKPMQSTIAAVEVKKRHWIRTFNASLQFSQAYVSPNWYQGGNNNVNALLNLYYNVKLNNKLHPKLLFENTFQYKLGINSAPDDTLRNYNVSEDIFQINTLFGYKAASKWYYSATGQFKTQLVNSYGSNSNNLRSAFMSPAELNIGLGMTYNTANPKKTFTLDASISPLSYNMKICTNDRLNPASFGIAAGHHAVHKWGSSAEVKMFLRLAYNITLNTRLFGFTDYHRTYTDWENTMVFEINQFLTTQLFVHLRYDSEGPQLENTKWKKVQMKEILSLGFAYKFSTI